MTTTAFLYPDKSLGLPNSRYEVDPAGFDIGRHSESALSLLEESVSRHHARLHRDGAAWILTDLGSSNGTFVNGQQVSGTVAVHDGDVLTLGKANLTFRSSGEAGASTANDHEEDSSGVRLVGDEESASIILSTKISDKTPFTTAPATKGAREQLDQINQRLLALYRLSDILRGAVQRDTIVSALLDLVFESLPADRGVVLKLDDDTGELTPEQFHFRDGTTNHEMTISRTIMRRSLDERVAVLSRDVHADSTLQSSESMMQSDVRSAMCVPLAGKRSLMGLLVLDTREALHAFTEDDLAFVSALATDAAMTLENLELVEENLRQERLAAVGQTIAGLAHNIKNILQLARGGTDLMDMAIANRNLDEVATLWPITKRSVLRMQALVQEMLDFSRPSTVNLTSINLHEIVDQVAETVQGEARAKGITLEVRQDAPPGPVSADPDVLQKALMNLLSNAFDALEGRKDGRVTLTTGVRHGHPFIQVSDNGPGIPPENQTKVFQPFFSTKASRGNGLGLSMTRKYIEDMGGRLELHSEPGNGCQFDIIFPA